MSASRHDLYGPVHKGLRAMLSDLLQRLGRTDFGDAAAGAAMLADLRAQLKLGASHLHHEDLHIHAALAARAPDAVAAMEAQHDEHRDSFDALERLIAAVEADPCDALTARRLYLRFSQYVAEDLAHMAEEEQVVQPLLWSLFSDGELQAIEGAIVGSMPPEESMAFLRLMIPAITPEERVAFLSFVRAGAPPEAFAAIVDGAARAMLPANDWQVLAERLGLAA